MALEIRFNGEVTRLEVPSDEERDAFTFTLGRIGDLVLGDSEYLHRQLLSITHDGRLWWITNVGSRIHVGLSLPGRETTWWLLPDQSQPFVFEEVLAQLSAGGTSYDFELGLVHEDPPIPSFDPSLRSATAAGPVTEVPVLTKHERRVLAALMEPMLLGEDEVEAGGGRRSIRSHRAAATRLGMTPSAVNQVLNRICDDLERNHGIDGLYGRERQATLITFVLQQGIIIKEDLELLDPNPGDCGSS